MTAESCLLTRGGDVVLTGTAAQAGPEVVVRLLDDLLASCSNPGRFAGAVDNGTALEMIEELSEHITAKRRRVEVASVALRGLAAEADAARAMADAAEQDPAADLDDDFIAAPTPAASPPDLARPWVAGLVPPPASPMLDDQTVALPGDFAVGDAEVRRPGLDEVAPVSLRELVAAANAAADVAHAMAGADEQHPSAGVDDVIGAPTPAASPPDLSWSSVTALAPPSAIPMLDDQRVARLGDFAVGDAQVRRPGLDEKAPVSLHELVAAANAAADAARAMADAAEQDPGADLDDDFIAAPTPAASPTDWRGRGAALAPPPASPTIRRSDGRTARRLRRRQRGGPQGGRRSWGPDRRSRSRSRMDGSRRCRGRPGNRRIPSAGYASERDAAAGLVLNGPAERKAAGRRRLDGQVCQEWLLITVRPNETCQPRGARVFGPGVGRRRDPGSSIA